MAADLAAFYSDLRNEARADVTYTSPKHVTKPPRAPPGAVRLRDELGTHVGRPDAGARRVQGEARGVWAGGELVITLGGEVLRHLCLRLRVVVPV